MVTRHIALVDILTVWGMALRRANRQKCTHQRQWMDEEEIQWQLERQRQWMDEGWWRQWLDELRMDGWLEIAYIMLIKMYSPNYGWMRTTGGLEDRELKYDARQPWRLGVPLRDSESWQDSEFFRLKKISRYFELALLASWPIKWPLPTLIKFWSRQWCRPTRP